MSTLKKIIELRRRSKLEGMLLDILLLLNLKCIIIDT